MINQPEHLLGTIIKKQKKKVYQKNSEFYQQVNYKLLVKNIEEQYTFFAYANVLTKQIFTIIQQGTYLGKNYLFTVKKNK